VSLGAELADALDRSAGEADESVLEALGSATSLDLALERIGPERLAPLFERAITRGQRDGLRSLLDLVRRPSVLRHIDPAARDRWAARILAAIDASAFTVGALFEQRVRSYGSRVLFQLSESTGSRVLSFRLTASRVESIARGILALEEGGAARVAILSDNRIEAILVDLACLTTGIVDVMIPANATETDVAYMLRQAECDIVFALGPSAAAKVVAQRGQLPRLRHVVSLDALDEVVARGERIEAVARDARARSAAPGDLATIMFTSGTTGTPKGIRFSQRNLVFKRFARALALPEIGEDDTFVCFLPIYHTFGRFLEVLGCVFWGATYCSLESPDVDALVRGMRRHRPTVFISVPKKWMQLHEAIAKLADPATASDIELARATGRITGGRLRYGLSAAGHLDADVFRFFQRQGIELLSGFGMTEATGGILMTPPGAYHDDSLGVPLPGIEARLAEDGELIVRGPYVMQGYLEAPGSAPSFDEQGWFHTGDLMEQDADGYFRLVDRKKEIYKNIKGETIAPQRIENLFRDFESVGRAFLVGDHREYNTLLLWPSPDYRARHLSGLSPSEIKDHYRSIVVSVNRFLAPYERIVDFVVIDRDLDLALGELTEKGTPRRPQVVRNFEAVLRQLYRRTVLHVGGLDLTVTNWMFQALGLTANDLRVTGDGLVLPGSPPLQARRDAEGEALLGSCVYRYPPDGPLNLGVVLTTPRLWLGNDALVRALPIDLTQRVRPGRAAEGMAWIGRTDAYVALDADRTALGDALRHGRHDLKTVHLAACLLGAADAGLALSAIKLLGRIVASTDESLAEPVRTVLARAAEAADREVARRAFQLLVPAERESRFRATVERFLMRDAELIDAETRADLAKSRLPDAKLETFVDLTREAASSSDEAALPRAASLLRFLAAYGAAHPATYRRLRAFLVRTGLSAVQPSVRAEADEAADTLQKGFRTWLGPNARIAVDPETGQEYGWDDVVVFDDEVPEADRSRLLSAIKNTPLLREASFLFSKGILLRIDDIPTRGIWVRALGARPDKATYRLTLQTRFHGGYDLAVSLNHGLTAEQVDEEIRWLILSGESLGREPLVAEFGGYWKRQDLWSAEFVTGETLARAMRRLSRRPEERERFRQIWPFLAWTALAGYVDFWRRTGRQWEIADPSMTGIVVPTDDFHTGVRIVSLTWRRPHRGLLVMLRSFRDEFVRPAEEQYPELLGLVGPSIVFSAVLEVFGEEAGLELLASARDSGPEDAELLAALDGFVDEVRRHGFLPRRLHFAVERYLRWERLSTDATPVARARTLQELYETYGLQALAQDYPETRLRFFRETVLRDGSSELRSVLDDLIGRLRRRELVGDELIDAVAEARARLRVSQDEDYFLARLSLPYLRPEDAANFVSSDLGGRSQSEIVVSLEDQEGGRFRVRHALNPKEVGRLHKLFFAAKLDVHFRPEHRYLVAINDRQQILGGIYYEIEEGGESAHLEKIVVAEAWRRKGVADGLMGELFNRLRAAGVKTVTTGFFRPEYFYGYGFRIEKRYAGLVKSLTD
jgi:long-subunit acyl-CoA synthetase (AMP-forming)/GNAT superfamily N-acetyltransferase